MKIYLKTLGCRANHYDTESVRALVVAGGHQIASDPTGADVAIFNSCAVTAEAEAELRKVVRSAARANPRLSSIVTGCAAGLDDERRQPTARLRSLPNVDKVIAGVDLPEIARALALPSAAPVVQRQTGTRALLRIQDGCDEHCTFCATTLARGANRSRGVDGLVREAQSLAEYHPEIVLTGIHIGSYGADIGTSLGALVERLVAETSRVRFRLSSIEATEVDDRLARLLTEDASRVAPHLHAPLQSGSDRSLRRMGRHWYRARSYAAAVERLARRTSIFGLGADVIAGFPGEDVRDHRETLSMVSQLPFTYLHVFPYSRRPGTAADRLDGHLHPEVVRDRARDLREAGRTKSTNYIERRRSGSADVIVLGLDQAGRCGLTEDFLDVLVDGPHPRGARFNARLLPFGSDRLAATAA